MYYVMLIGLGIILGIIIYFILKDETIQARNLWLVFLSTLLLADWVVFLRLVAIAHSGSLTQPIW